MPDIKHRHMIMMIEMKDSLLFHSSPLKTIIFDSLYISNEILYLSNDG